MSAEVRLGLVGFGAVARAFAALLAVEEAHLHSLGVAVRVVGVCTARSGSRIDPDGLDLRELLARAEHRTPHGPPLGAERFAAECPADVIVETLPLEPHMGEPAASVIRAALQAGRHVVSANKGPVAHHLGALRAEARAHGVTYRFESAVADGMPVINLIERTLPGADVLLIEGVVNSTSAMVLDALAEGRGPEEAIAAAQAVGIAEADPRHDLEGWDAAVKLASLSAVVFDRTLDLAKVSRPVIDDAAAARARAARAAGRRLVSLASVRRTPDGAAGTVELVEIGLEHPFFHLTGASLGLRITSRLLTPITITSEEPLNRDTAYGLLSDLLWLCRGDPGEARGLG